MSINGSIVSNAQHPTSIAGEFIRPSCATIIDNAQHPTSIAGEFIRPLCISKILLIIVLISASILRGLAQKKENIVTKNFKFENGIYASFSDWQRNKPTYKWDSIETTFAVNPVTFLMQMEVLRVKKTGKMAQIDSIWGVVVDGIPYVRLPRHEIAKPTTCFAGFILRGGHLLFSV